MANVKVSELPAASAASTSQEFEVNDSGTSKKVTGSQIKSFVKDGLVLTDITDVTASITELNFVSGVTSAIQTQLGTIQTQLDTKLNEEPLAGAVVVFARSTAPTGWLKANGALVSRTTYATLFAAIGTTFGAGDGSTTFQLPDLRGEFLRGWDDGRGVDSGRVFGSAQAEGTNNVRDIFTSSTASAAGSTGTKVIPQDGSYSDYTITGRENSDVFWNFRMRHTGAETRPRNCALLTCIKY